MLEQGQTFDSFTSSRQRREKWSELLLLLVLASLSSASPVPTDDVSRVREFEFSAQLQNPCFMASSSRPTAQERLATRRLLIRELKGKVLLLNATAATILKRNVLHDCSSLSLSQIARVPIAEEILNSAPGDVLRQFYTSLMNHTAHILFISHQLEQYSGESCSSEGLPASAKALGKSMSDLMCVLRLSIQSVQDEDEDDADEEQLAGETSRILDEYLVDQPMCSRRSVRDCQAVLSTCSLFTEMSYYLQSKSIVDDEDPS